MVMNDDRIHILGTSQRTSEQQPAERLRRQAGAKNLKSAMPL
jgi:hypothetical protein